MNFKIIIIESYFCWINLIMMYVCTGDIIYTHVVHIPVCLSSDEDPVNKNITHDDYYLDICPSMAECSKLGGDCIRCNTDGRQPKCLYGSTINAICTHQPLMNCTVSINMNESPYHFFAMYFQCDMRHLHELMCT